MEEEQASPADPDWYRLVANGGQTAELLVVFTAPYRVYYFYWHGLRLFPSDTSVSDQTL